MILIYKIINLMVMKKIIQVALISVFVLSACDLNHTEKETEFNITEKTARLLEAENEFGFQLFRLVYAAETEDDNVMLSPLSVSLALAMTYNGANGETKTAMEKTLKVYGLTPNDINKSYFDLVNGLKSLDEKVLLEIANAIYYRN
jgi:serine protease inhibitor